MTLRPARTVRSLLVVCLAVMVCAAPVLGQDAPSGEPGTDDDDVSVEPAPSPPGLVFYRGNHMGLPVAVSILGQYRPRAEATPDRELTGTPNRLLLSHRARLGAGVAAGEHIQAVFQLQDVRYFGTEMSVPGFSADPTAGSVAAAGLDMREVYLVLKGFGLTATLGRMEVQLDEGRLIAWANFPNNGRSLDGARFDYAYDDYKLTAMWAVEQTADSPLATAPELNQHLLFAYAELPVLSFLEFRPMNTLEVQFGDDVDPWARWTTGINIISRFNGAYSKTEFFYQGTSDARLRPAGLVGNRLGYVAPVALKPQVEVFLDVLTGRQDAGVATQTFRPVRGLRHVFYGWHDMFTNMPVHTNDRGLIDAGLRGMITGDSFFVDTRLHFFSAAVLDGVEHPGRSLFGIEPNLLAGYRPWPLLELSVLASAFFPVGTGLQRGNAPYSSWVVFQLDFKL